jgi:hypothetical protein
MLLAGAALVTLAAGCHASAGHPAGAAQPARAVLAEAVRASGRARSEQVTGFIETTFAGLRTGGTAVVSGTLSATFTARVSLAGGLVGEMTLSQFTADGRSLPGRISTIFTSRAMYVHAAALTRRIGRAWLELPYRALSQAAHLNFASLLSSTQEIDPTQYVALLEKSGQVREVGHPTLNGSPTTLYVGTVDPRRELPQLPPAVRSLLERSYRLNGVPRSDHIDLWLDPSGLPRRVIERIIGAHETGTVQFDVLAYNVPVTASAPPAKQTLEVSQLPGG